MAHIRLYDEATRGTTPRTRWYRLDDGAVVGREPGERIPRGAVAVDVAFARPAEDDGTGIVARLLPPAPPPVPPGVDAVRPVRRVRRRTPRRRRAARETDDPDASGGGIASSSVAAARSNTSAAPAPWPRLDTGYDTPARGGAT